MTQRNIKWVAVFSHKPRIEAMHGAECVVRVENETPSVIKNRYGTLGDLDEETRTALLNAATYYITWSLV